ncbi:DUF2550 domain-containing protein [Aeromicrobium sp. YIM 150415]|uniref:DUF2550 domain-containing protein n=1 Tax=Aeromicrobium sp. YIM 150415 TaxID=2803912 RepID=UPI001963EBA4|nr:DUF2550 domain-containing protein [Aeromicrobium sp. YIM 150415]MBM9462936.1 DUF2550 domain-containing protein [Aeromicrobium sp. YIM 150415]
MPLWLWLVDSLALLVALSAFLLVALVVRRRWLTRRGGAFEMSVNRHPEASARGWMLGIAVYRSTEIEWFRGFSLSPRPKYRLPRGAVQIDGRRPPQGAEAYALHDSHVIVDAQSPTPIRQLALSPSSLTGLLAWLESSPPGQGVNNVL